MSVKRKHVAICICEVYPLRIIKTSGVFIRSRIHWEPLQELVQGNHLGPAKGISTYKYTHQKARKLGEAADLELCATFILKFGSVLREAPNISKLT